MNLKSHLAQRALRLAPLLTRNPTIERDPSVPIRNGIVLLTDRWAPKTGNNGLRRC
jgi:hypothetical protein